MTGNGCYGNIRAGIGTQTGERANIVENECRNNTRAGIGVRKEGNANILSNQCVENKPVGIRSKSDAYIARNDTISCSAISIPSATLYEQQRRYWLAQQLLSTWHTDAGCKGVRFAASSQASSMKVATGFELCNTWYLNDLEHNTV